MKIKSPRRIRSVNIRSVNLRIGMLSISFALSLLLTGCESMNAADTPPEWKAIGENELPTTFNPPDAMTFVNAEQAKFARKQGTGTEMTYVGSENENIVAYIYVQALPAGNLTFVDRAGSADDFRNTVQNQIQNIETMGEGKSSTRVDYQHYTLTSGAVCVAMQKFPKPRGSGNVGGGATARGSIRIYGQFCEPEGSQINADRRDSWIKSVNYRKR